MAAIALTILSDVDDPSEAFVEVAAPDVRTPPSSLKIGVVVSRAGNDPWLSPQGWSAQPPPSQLPVRVGSSPGTSPLLLLLPRSWAQHIDPYEAVRISCPALDFEGAVAWFYTGANLPVSRNLAPPPEIEAVSPRESAPEPPPPVIDPPVVVDVAPPVEAPQADVVVDEPAPVVVAPEVVSTNTNTPPLKPKRRIGLLWPVLGALVVIGGVAAAVLLQPKQEVVAAVDPAPPAISPQQKFEDAQRAEQADQCASASELMHAAADEGVSEADFRLGESYDPSGDAARIGCLAQDWNIVLALSHYSKACSAGHAVAPERVKRLSAWVETTAKIGDGSSLELQAQMAQSSVPAAKTACGLE